MIGEHGLGTRRQSNRDDLAVAARRGQDDRGGTAATDSPDTTRARARDDRLGDASIVRMGQLRGGRPPGGSAVDRRGIQVGAPGVRTQNSTVSPRAPARQPARIPGTAGHHVAIQRRRQVDHRGIS